MGQFNLKTNKMKQTAVKWFYQRILSKDIKAVFEQAKAMEKQQIKDAYESLEHRHGENYYNEIFKQQENETDSI